MSDALAAYVADLATQPFPDAPPPAPAGTRVAADPGTRVVLVTTTAPAGTAAALAARFGAGTAAAPVPAASGGTSLATAYATGSVATVVAYEVPGGPAAVAVRWPPDGPPQTLRLDRRTGALTVERRTVGPGTHRLAADALGGSWRDMGTGWAWLDVPHEEPDGGRWYVSLGFEGAGLARATLAHAAPGPAAPDWDEAAERAADARHQEWLRAQAGSDREFAWGSAGAGHDPKGGFAAVTLRYEVRP